MNDEQVKFENLSDSALRARIDIKAAPEKVYAAWTDQNQFIKWFGPRADGRLEVQKFDCSVGGHYDVTMVFADGDRVQIIGSFQELDPPKKVVLTWQWSGEAPSEQTLVTVDLLPSDQGTLLVLTHERFSTAQIRDNHRGWEPILVRLASVLTN